MVECEFDREHCEEHKRPNGNAGEPYETGRGSAREKNEDGKHDQSVARSADHVGSAEYKQQIEGHPDRVGWS